MKPRNLIPTCLLAACVPLSAASISVNLGADWRPINDPVEAPTLPSGAIAITGEFWNNASGASGTLGSLIDSTGATTGGSITWSSNNTYRSNAGAQTATSENADLTKGYLDDGGPGWSVSLNSPYLLNDIYIIHSTDGSGTMAAVSVNGTYYKGDTAGGTILASGASDTWAGSPWSDADTLIESDNYLKVLAQPGVVLAADRNSARAAIAGVQVEDAYSGTLSYWDTNGTTAESGDAGGTWGTDPFWTATADGTGTPGAWTAGNAAVFSAGADALSSNLVTVSSTQVADAVWLQEGDIELSGGIVDLSSGLGLLRADGSSILTVTSQVTAADLSTVGFVDLNSATNSISGTVTVTGETRLGANNTWGQLAGGGILDVQGNTLTVGDATNSSFGGTLTGTTGSALDKTGTGTLTVPDILANLDAVTISDGGLTLTGGGNAFWTLSGSGNLTKTGGGTLVIESTGNTGYSGKTTATGGILRIPGQDTLGSTPASVVPDSIILSGGAKIQGGDGAGGFDLTLDANRGITLAGGTSGFHTWTGFTTTVNGDINGTGSLASHDGGTLIINGDVNVTGSLHTNGGQPSATTYNSSSLIAGDGFNLRAGTTTLNVGTATLQDIELGNAGSQAHQLTQVAGDVSVTDDIRIGHWGGATSTYTMQGGTLTQPDTVTNPHAEGQANFFLGIDGTGVLNLEGGTINTSSMVVDGRNYDSGAGTLAVTGGALNIGKWGIRTNFGNYTVELGGGTIGATADWSSDLNVDLTGTNGDITFNPMGNSISLSGILSGAGGLVKAGSGTLALSGGLGTYAGNTQVNGGTLQVNSEATGTSPVAIASGASIASGTPGTPGPGTVETLNLAAGTSSTFRVGGAADDQVVVFAADGLTVASTHTINVHPVGAVSDGDTFPVFDYDGTIQGAGIGAFAVTQLANPHYVLTVADNAVDTTVDVTVNLVEIAWTGSGGTAWDLSTSNWINGGVSNFYESDVVNFNDLDPTESVVVDASGGAIAPATMKFNNTTASTYTISGDAISGPGGLTKTGDGTVILTNDSTFSGAIDVQAGTLQVGDGGTTGSLAGGAAITVASGAEVVVDRSDASTFARTVSGGTFVKNGTGDLTMTSSNSATNIVVNGGSLLARGGNWGTTFCSGQITVNSGGTLDNTTHSMGGLGGATLPSVNLNGGTWNFNNEQYMNVLEMTEGTTTGGGEVRTTGGGVYTINAAPNPSVMGARLNVVGNKTFDVADGAADPDLLVSGPVVGGGAITKTGAGLIELTGTNTSWSGGVDVQGGSLRIASFGSRLGTGFLALKSGTLEYTGTGIETATNTLWIDGGGGVPLPAPGTFNIVEAGAVLTLAPAGGTVNQEVIKEGPGRLVLQGAITGGGSVTANTGRLDLDGSNSYTGDTTVNAGATIVMGLASLGDDSTVRINGSGVLDLDHGASDTVLALFIDGVEQATGTWGATGSGADNIDDVHFAGTGVLDVGNDYNIWAGSFGLDPNTDGAPGADPDKDGLTNDKEYAFGLSPTDGTSVNPISVPLDKGTAKFTYTRRDPAKTDLGYLVQTSTDLGQAVPWATDFGATQNVIGTVGDVQTVEVTLTGPLGNEVYVQVLAN